MNVKKTIKKIAAIAIGTAMLGSTMLSASATLEQFPAPFVANGMANVQLVIGSGSTDDYLGALDIATSLQAASVTQVAVAGTGSSVTVEGGYDVSEGNTLFLTDVINKSKSVYDETELPVLLAKGTIDHDGDEIKYNQELTLSNASIEYTTEEKEPTLRVNVDAPANIWNYTLALEDNLNMVNKNLSESVIVDMFGKKFTIPQDQSGVDADQLKVFGSDQTSYMELNTPKTVTVDGKSYTIEIVGANSDGDTATIIMDVNGVRKTIEEGKSFTINNLDLYVEDLFVTNIPTLSASANVFVGSNEIIFGNNAVKVDGDAITGLKSQVSAKSSKLVLSVQFDPSALDEDVAGFDKVKYLEAGDSVKDPLFGTLGVEFVGSNYALDDSAKAAVELTSSDEEISLKADLEDGTANLIISTVSGSTATAYTVASDNDGFVGSDNTGLTVGDIFILNENDNGVKSTKLYRIESFDEDDGVELTNIANGEPLTVDFAANSNTTSEKIGDTSVTFTNVDVDAETADLTAVSTDVFLKGGKQLLSLGNLSNILLSELEVSTDLGDSNRESFNVTFLRTGSDDTEISIAANNASNVESATSNDDDTKTYLTKAGTYVVADTSDDKNYVKMFVPVDEDTTVEYTVALTSEGTTVSKTATGTTTDKVNPIAVGVAVRDADVNIANPSKNLIVIGGTCINSVSAKLKNVAANTCGEASGLKPGEATIELFTLDNGKVAMLVAGWEAVDTQAAARAVATKAPGLTGNKVTLSVTSANQYTIKQ